MDFYSVCAKYWGVDRWLAKTRLHTIYFYSKCRIYNIDVPGPDQSVRLEPSILVYVPSEARAELLEYYGIVLGDN